VNVEGKYLIKLPLAAYNKANAIYQAKPATVGSQKRGYPHLMERLRYPHHLKQRYERFLKIMYGLHSQPILDQGQGFHQYIAAGNQGRLLLS